MPVTAAASKKAGSSSDDKVLLLGVTGITGRCACMLPCWLMPMGSIGTGMNLLLDAAGVRWTDCCTEACPPRN